MYRSYILFIFFIYFGLTGALNAQDRITIIDGNEYIAYDASEVLEYMGCKYDGQVTNCIHQDWFVGNNIVFHGYYIDDDDIGIESLLLKTDSTREEIRLGQILRMNGVLALYYSIVSDGDWRIAINISGFEEEFRRHVNSIGCHYDFEDRVLCDIIVYGSVSSEKLEHLDGVSETIVFLDLHGFRFIGSTGFLEFLWKSALSLEHLLIIIPELWP